MIDPTEDLTVGLVIQVLFFKYIIMEWLECVSTCILWENSPGARVALGKTATIHQVTTMLATSKNVLFPGPHNVLNHLC